ncbi:MAG: rhamnulokinase [Oscillospiraceae bacterium]|nr:rhamnulokinase [Oscillospiraceae bacterium]
MGKRVLAFDLGASSGRAMLARFDGSGIEIEEIHRFSNDPVLVNGTLYWDVLRLFFEIKQGISKAHHAGGFDSIGIDTWGVDFGFLDEDGILIENPVHYRDTRHAGYGEKAFKKLSKERAYEISGLQFMDINTAIQLYSIAENRPQLLKRAKTMLFMPDLLCYMLTGEKNTEYSIASTSQLLDAKKRDWSGEILNALGIPKDLFAPIVKSGTKVGRLSDEICSELGVSPVDVIATCEHDTASAVVSVPAAHEDFIYISSGTWSLFGTELKEPMLDEKARKYNITNEGGFGGSIRFLKNIMGLWLIQESRRQWIREGKTYSFQELEGYAREASPFQCFINPDAPEFIPQGNMPRRVQEYCKRTGQYVPENPGEILRCIYESIAMTYRESYRMISDATGKQYSAIHIVGGGTKDSLLCRMAADACGVNVTAGPVEATVLGNVAVQLIAMNEIADISKARKIISDSQKITSYTPKDTQDWDLAFIKYKAAK